MLDLVAHLSLAALIVFVGYLYGLHSSHEGFIRGLDDRDDEDEEDY